jgi:hypothetical protein
MALTIDFKKSDIDNHILITVNSANQVLPTVGRNVVIAYDHSGSMNEIANEKGEGEAKLFTKNDLAKRAVEIIALGLNENDTLTIIGYESYISTKLATTKMTVEGKQKVTDALNAIKPGGCTELWGGIKKTLEIAQDLQTSSNNDTCVIVITDGVPSNSPANGELYELENYRKTKSNKIRMHTIGVGYGINSKLLNSLAIYGDLGGQYLFIPDGSMVITNFVNLMANESVIIAKDVQLSINMTNAKNLLKIKSLYSTSYTSDTNIVINIGTLIMNQSKELLISYDTPKEDLCFTSKLTYSTMDSKFNMVSKNYDWANVITDNNVVEVHKSLYNLNGSVLTAIKTAALNIDDARKIIASVIDSNIQQLPIYEDLTGEIASGLESNKSWKKWGEHYILSLICAHKNKLCTNFKDPGTKQYMTPESIMIREKLDNECKDLAPPVPSGYSYGNSSSYNVPVTSASFNSIYNNPSGGCFAGEGNVLMYKNTLKKVKDIKKGDRLAFGATVLCVTVFEYVNTITYIDGINLLKLTPWHPVIKDGQWVFPINEMIKYTNTSDITIHKTKVYNFVLDSVHLITVNNIVACTFGHNISGPVIGHKFYGTDAVVNDLKKMNGWNNGYINITTETNLWNEIGVEHGFTTH